MRSDLPGQPRLAADVALVVDTSRGTTLGQQGVQVHTVEHTLAALVGLQLDNVLIELDGPEPPVMDGSALAFVEALQGAGRVAQDAVREYFTVETPIHIFDSERKSELTILPATDFRATVMIDFDSETLRPQHASLPHIGQFADEIASSRTFCFLHELEQLHRAGLVQGGALDNAVVIVDGEMDADQLARLQALFPGQQPEIRQGILNPAGLRHENEPARHKLLDIVGDLALVGVPLKGHVIASRPGHSVNVELARRIKAQIKQQRIAGKFQKQKKEGIIFDINAIHDILPHRYPFLLVDKILDFSETTIRGIKNVTINEPFFQGHFPGNPIMPGVLQLEAMAQVGGILLLNTIDNPKTVWVYFVAIDNARFKKPVIPGDTLLLELEMTALRRGICKMTGKGFVDDQLACSADLVASVVPKNTL
ncbi:MAG: bifunctional UDP-3-O-[3-hydroxymyristoyl] N-acetylglucosamine deacetylase/3-hydroxyacyl-ACP dehydratase [Bacteroidia bacterium]